jgi:hypothetical protein
MQGMVSTYAWVSGGELPSQRLRSYTFGLAAAVGFLGAVSLSTLQINAGTANADMFRSG